MKRKDDLPEQEECMCGHIADEHEDGQAACTVESCKCIYFEKKEEKN